MKNTIVISAVLVVIAGILGFFGGMKYQQSQRATFTGRFGQGIGTQGAQGERNRTGFRPVNGEILSTDDKSMTVKLQDGSSRIVLFSDKTTISKAADATHADLTVNTRVAAFGIDNPDGSLTAQNIQINPIMRLGGNGPQGQGGPQGSPSAAQNQY
jgi:hypothetical protein